MAMMCVAALLVAMMGLYVQRSERAHIGGIPMLAPPSAAELVTNSNGLRTACPYASLCHVRVEDFASLVPPVNRTGAVDRPSHQAVSQTRTPGLPFRPPKPAA
jgi:hypothetical protein